MRVGWRAVKSTPSGDLWVRDSTVTLTNRCTLRRVLHCAVLSIIISVSLDTDVFNNACSNMKCKTINF